MRKHAERAVLAPTRAMEDPPRWGRVDPSAAATALSVSIPLAVVISVAIICMGRWSALPEQRRRGARDPVHVEM